MQNIELNNIKNCPRCNKLLVDDYWDIVVEDEKGNFILDVFDAWVCQNRCGYFVKKRKEDL